MTTKSVQQCASTMDGLRCELVSGHKGKHSATAWKNGEMPRAKIAGLPTKGKRKKNKTSLYWVGVSWVDISDKKCDCGKHGEEV